MLANSLEQVAKGIFIECLPSEIDALKHRNQLQEWAGVNTIKTRLVDFFKQEVSKNQKLISKILKIKPVKTKLVMGSDPDETLNKLLADQSDLIDNMHKLRTKFYVSTSLQDEEIARQEAKLFTLALSDEDMHLLRGRNTSENSGLQNNAQAVLIERLQEALSHHKITSEDVCNLLNNDLYEQEKLAYQLESRDNKSFQRFNAKHLQIIARELHKKSEDRDLKLLDTLLSHLKFFKK